MICVECGMPVKVRNKYNLCTRCWAELHCEVLCEAEHECDVEGERECEDDCDCEQECD